MIYRPNDSTKHVLYVVNVIISQMIIQTISTRECLAAIKRRGEMVAVQGRQLITKTRLFKYIENLTSKNLRYFSYFCSKHRFWILIGVEYLQSVYEYPHSMLLSKNKKGNVYPCKPPFDYIKVGFKGVIVYRHVFVISFTLLCFPSEQESTLNGKNILILGAPHQWLL